MLQLKVMNSPFNQEQTDLLNRLLPTMTVPQKLWLSGYLAASQSTFEAGASAETAVNPFIQKKISKEVTILYASQSGNAQSFAKKAGKVLEGNRFSVAVWSMGDFKPKDLKKVQNLLVIASTHGEGDPPDNARTFYEFLHSKRAPKLEGLNFSVLALGDSSYEFFCKVGKDLDRRLEQLGGTRIYPRIDCDVDYEEQAQEWLQDVLQVLDEQGGGTASSGSAPESLLQAEQTEYSKTNPFHAEVLENINLNGRGSHKETRHLEISLEGSGLTYAPGDALGIYPVNDPALVELLLEELPWNPDETVTVNKHGDVYSLKEALRIYYEITALTKPLLEKAAQLSGNKELAALLNPEKEETLKAYLHGRDLLDLIHDFGPWGGSAQEFVSALRKIPARLYSIASSQTANPEEVHVTVGAVRYQAHGRLRKGVCSCFCAERLEPGDKLRIFIQHNDQFKLPENPEVPIIMVGPGTGVAPFRAFMQEREERGAKGKSWLFFGDQHFRTDFLYQTEWQQWLKDGVLTKMDVAFSRDTDQKVYVQHRMLEHSKELFQWLKEGAVVYVCGDQKNMAKDVEITLLDIIANEGEMSSEEALNYLKTLQQQKRYLRDVY